MPYYRPFLNSGVTNIYCDDVSIVYHIDWVLVAMGASDACIILEV